LPEEKEKSRPIEERIFGKRSNKRGIPGESEKARKMTKK